MNPQWQEKIAFQDAAEQGDQKRVMVGFVDCGLDFMHRNFRHLDGSSRILALWDQTANQTADPETDSNKDSQHGDHFKQAMTLWQKYGYGRLHTKPEIDAAINAADEAIKAPDKTIKTLDDYVQHAYRKLGYEPPKDSLSRNGAHGTSVADVAVGNGNGTGIPGIAPEADIVFVEVASASVGHLGHSLGDSAQLLEAVKFIFDFAKLDQRPCVVNISLGTNGGPHDGSTLVEMALDALVSAQPNRAVVIAAGNTYSKDLHVRGRVKQSGSVELKWQIPGEATTPSGLEIWYSARDKLTVEVMSPQGNTLGQIAHGCQQELLVGQSQKVKSDGDVKRVSVINCLQDPNNHAKTIKIALDPAPTAEEWTVRLHGTSVEDGEFHAWIERDKTAQSRFVEPENDDYEIADECTLNTIACGRHTVVVGSYNATGQSWPSGNTSSAGPTRDGRRKPDISAPGESVLAAHSRTVVLRHRVSGTSLAAPVVTGAIALMLSEAQQQGVSLRAKEILRILKNTAQREPGDRRGWDPRKGYGRVSVKDAIAAVKAVTHRKMKPQMNTDEHR